jgi:cyclohexanecarboxylate-CoA ligase
MKPTRSGAMRGNGADAGPTTDQNPDLWTLVEQRALDHPVALMAVDERGDTLTFSDLRSKADRVAAGFAARGVTVGTRVTWLLPNSLDAIVLVTALSRLGAVQNPLLPLYGRHELSFVCRQFDPQLLVVPDHWRGIDYAAMARVLTSGTGRDLFVLDGALPETEPSSPPHGDAPATTDVRWVFYTSGTSGDPKGVCHSDASLATCASIMQHQLEVTDGDMWPIVFPITHVGGIATLWAQLLAGSSAAIVARFDPDTTIAAIAQHPLTVATGGTALVMLYLEAQRKERHRIFPHLRVALAGTAPKPPTLHDDVRRELGGHGVVSIYGLTEAPYTTFGTVADEEWALATTEGAASPGVEILVTDEEGRPVPAGTEGEVRIRGPHVCSGYVDESLNAEAFDAEGFFRSGDLGILKEGGYLVVTGRLKDIIIRNGENISAKELEDLLFGHPGIRDVAVFAVPDAALGERCCVAVVGAPGAPTVELDEVVRYLSAGGVARYKLPERLVVLDELPRNATGKVRKAALASLIHSDSAPRE